MLKKLKFGSSLAALILFALPWLDIQCSEKSLGTQSGVQIIYGGGSPAEGMESSESDSKNSMEKAPLVGLAFLAVIGAVLFSGIALFFGGKGAEILSSALPAAALILLLVQMKIGFPVQNEIEKSMAESRQAGGDDSSAFGSAMGAAVMMNFRVKTLPVFYFELLALGIPTLLFANGLIDRLKKAD